MRTPLGPSRLITMRRFAGILKPAIRFNQTDLLRVSHIGFVANQSRPWTGVFKQGNECDRSFAFRAKRPMGDSQKIEAMTSPIILLNQSRLLNEILKPPEL